MPAVKRIRTLALPTTKPDEAERFFTQVLGGKIANRIQHPGDGGTIDEVFIEVGNVRVALASLDGGSRAPSGFPHYTLAIDYQPRAELEQALAAAGAAIEGIREHNDGKGYSCYVRDPDGNRYELWVSEAE
ncbi:MAG TPA: VOC family protein [Chloroflexota bacterium]|nr:VOC family protein [Chloroflexota bacterium]